jgi:hypothetical protein
MYNLRMRAQLVVLLVVSACHASDPAGADAAPAANAPRTYPFGPFTIQASQEITTDCVQITLHNDTTLFVNQVELTTGPGFHHSNWFFVPASDDTTGVIGPFDGPDGTFTCNDRGFDQVVAGLKGGVIFAQSTQSVHDVQSFPAGAVVQVPPHSKLVAQIHLLNASDGPLTLSPSITLTPILEHDVTIRLSGVSFEDHALGLPPNHESRFSVDCDLQPQWNTLLANGSVTSPTPDFNLYYALAHYHVMGTGMSIDALAADDSTSETVFATTSQVGDALGGTINPPISMTGYSRLRFSCDYYNNTAATVGWGNGNAEMCVFLAFSDSAYNWAGGALDSDPPGPATMDGDVMTYSHACQVFAVEQSTH